MSDGDDSLLNVGAQFNSTKIEQSSARQVNLMYSYKFLVDAYLKSSKSSVTCSKKEEYTPEDLNLLKEIIEVRELKKAANKGLYEAAEAFKRYVLNQDKEKSESLREKFSSTALNFNSDINAVVDKIVEVEHQRFHYLQCKSICNHNSFIPFSPLSKREGGNVNRNSDRGV
ncbi:unnamed protein product [Trichobilharzia regenti]|nr:unnamed protein product [Trichobilharzia regenti]